MTKVFVAGHKGLVGSAICRRLKSQGAEPIIAGRSELDLLSQAEVYDWFKEDHAGQSDNLRMSVQ